MLIADGFPGQRMLVLPRPRVREFLDQPGTNHLVVTDCGYFPEAQSHGRTRNTPLTQAVVIVCAKGKGWCETAAGRFEVAPGQVVVLPPGHPHAYGADADDPWTLWWIHVAGRELPGFLTAANMTIEAPVRRPANVYPIVTLMTEVVQWMERDSTTPSLLAAAGAAWHALTLLAADRTTSDATSDVIDQAAAYLRAHINEHVSVAELSAMARLSSSHFSALFKKHIGYPVLQYQTQLRMARAREMLDTTGQPVSIIAEAVGYPDAFYFTRQFRQVHGITPRDYRAQHKG
ncbi:MAG TPA: AraC family transcriptional regulator [Galbitalea sp.]|jgi:AraC-like DNA-binding protein